jgi:hypothetical protein
MRFTAVIHNAEGKILSQQFNATELALEGKSYIRHQIDGDLDDFYVSDGEVLSKSNAPSEGHIFNYATGSWDLDIDLARSLRWGAIKAARNAQERATFEWNGNVVQCDESSQVRIQAAVQAAIIDDSVADVWTFADNSTQTLNATELKAIAKALAEHVKACHERGRMLRAQINAATTLQELEAIVW